MKKIVFVCLFFFTLSLSAQTSANRFFYELTYKPSVESDSLIKEMTILDITSEKSLYRDYLMVSQDSILKIEVEQMQKSGTFKDLSKTLKQPKFSYKVTKTYPDMGLKYTDQILQDKVSYEETLKFDWKIQNEKKTIGEYQTQKATTTFGGRNWTAWFSTDIPFQDGPYKFYGLPGLIVQLSDENNNYSWELKGNKNVADFQEKSFAETFTESMGGRGNDLVVSRSKFDQLYEAYKKDPFGSIRSHLSQIPADAKMPDGTSIAKMMRDQEEMLKKHLNENNNQIEISQKKASK
ncbi:GLPGLI family protein [Chryseobacterium sp. A301]